MKISQKSVEFLQKFINGEEGPEYRSGQMLVSLFNDFGFDYSYGQGFPSRWMFTRDRIQELNGTPALKRLIEHMFSPEQFIDNEDMLHKYVQGFNKYLAFTGFEIQIRGKKLSLSR
jgi:hypothetical protein